jgi:hypothetical protein
MDDAVDHDTVAFHWDSRVAWHPNSGRHLISGINALKLEAYFGVSTLVFLEESISCAGLVGDRSGGAFRE